MGNNESSSSSTSMLENRLSQDIQKRIENECAVSTTSKNELNITGSTVSGTKIKLTNQVNGSCKMRAALNELMTTQSNISLAKDIAEQQMSAGMFKSNKTNTELYNSLSSVVDIKTMLQVVNHCMQSVNISNVINITNANVLNSEIEMNNTSFNECLQESLLDLANKNGMTAQAEAIVEKNQVTKGSSMFKGTIMKIVVWGLIGIIVLFLILKLLCRSKARFIPPLTFTCRIPFIGSSPHVREKYQRV